MSQIRNRHGVVLDTALAFQKLYPKDFFNRFIAQGVRPDGRGLTESRQMSVSRNVLPNADSSACVKLGNTQVMCGIRYAVRSVDRQADGRNIGIKVHLLPICSPEYRDDSEANTAIAVSVREFLYRSTGRDVIDESSFLIDGSDAHFVLFVDIVGLSDDGNIFDAALAALVYALQDLRLPDVKVISTGESQSVQKEDGLGSNGVETEVVQLGNALPNPIKLLQIPVSTTFGALDKDTHLVDPMQDELDVLLGTMSVVASTSGKLVSVNKFGGPAVSLNKLKNCFDIAIDRAKRFPV